MLEEDGVSPFTAHSTDPVPLVLVGRDDVKALAAGGVLADLAPTMLELLGLDKPEEMTGKSLIVKSLGIRRGKAGVLDSGKV